MRAYPSAGGGSSHGSHSAGGPGAPCPTQNKAYAREAKESYFYNANNVALDIFILY